MNITTGILSSYSTYLTAEWSLVKTGSFPNATNYNSLFIYSSSGIHRLDDFSELQYVTNSISPISLIGSGSNIYASLGNSGIKHTHDNGISWDTSLAGDIYNSTTNIWSTDGYMHANVDYYIQSFKRVYTSVDSGSLFNNNVNGIYWTHPHQTEIPILIHNIVSSNTSSYISVDIRWTGDGAPYVTQYTRIYKSTSGGSWSIIKSSGAWGGPNPGDNIWSSATSINGNIYYVSASVLYNINPSTDISSLVQNGVNKVFSDNKSLYCTYVTSSNILQVYSASVFKPYNSSSTPGEITDLKSTNGILYAITNTGIYGSAIQ